MSDAPLGLLPGRPAPLGAHWDGAGVNFAIHAGGAETVMLSLFDEGGESEIARIALPGRSGTVWHGFLPSGLPDQIYGYRIVGGGDPDLSEAAQAAKLLLDPYGRRLAGSWSWNAAFLPHSIGDTAPFAYRSQVMPAATSLASAARPIRPWTETVIYELHVKGFTQRHPEVPVADRGRFSGLAAPAVLAYLRDLGVTAVELLPVMAFLDEPALVQRGLCNHWGYNPISFFAPDPRYGSPEDFKAMVRAFHAAGIEVILDVVYNHTAEGDGDGPVYCWRGIDRATYYRFLDEKQRVYANDTGCGNAFDLSNAVGRQLVVDSLRYWVEVMGVDGFRFDLASTLLRDGEGFAPGSGFLDAVAQDPVLREVKLIAEPWDLGPGGYRLGQFPTDWREWNDRYRNGLRDFWLTRGANSSELATRISGSSDVFQWNKGKATASINYVTSHDGFTLKDLVTYEQKRNEANGEGNADGNSDNRNWNCGVEGPSDDPEIHTRRDLLSRALLATLLLSQGVPMLQAGDELGRSQGGNNNAYCQDNETSWLDWESRDGSRLALVRRLLELRRRFPQLGRGDWAGIAGQTHWFRADGQAMSEADWHKADGGSLGLELMPGDLEGACLVMLFNADPSPAAFVLKQANWSRLLDSGLPDGGPPQSLGGVARYRLDGRRVVLLSAIGIHA